MKFPSIQFAHIFYLLILFQLPSLSNAAQDVENIFSSANHNYKIGNFEFAVSEYEKLVSQGYEGTSLFYNLGNSYFRLGKLGKAILNYEKALKLSPGDEDVLHNLAFVNLKTVDKIETLPQFFLFQWWENLIGLFTVNGWSYFILGIFLLILICIVVYFFTKKIEFQKASFLTGLFLSLIFLFTASILAINLNREMNWKFGIVMTTKVIAKTSPDNQSKDNFLIHEGLKVKIEDELEDWYKIKLPDGKIGWVIKGELEII
ncbi:MAG: tetratricopeptide repeat protein [Ignavibacteriales bacterium]|nr:tetratricopeptide repeat protein [Ignavibacteriales bacterium]